MIGCGVISYRLGKRSEAEFFLAGRGLPWWLPATSIYATHTATDTPVWITGVVYKYGMCGMWIPFCCAWCAVSAFVSSRIFRRPPAAGSLGITYLLYRHFVARVDETRGE